MFFVDDAIEVHEALSMFIIYVIYAIIMKYNERLEAAVKIHFLGQAKISASECSTEVCEADVSDQSFFIIMFLFNLLPGGKRQGLNGQRTSLGKIPAQGNMSLERRVIEFTMPSFSKRISNESVSSIRADRRKSIPVLQSGALFRSSIATLAREGTISEEDNKTSMLCFIYWSHT
uniref:Bestrophin homolog n=1 Tax=Parascaris equorum TaxID=6256 RepID=A0A914S5K5_PAREQ